MKLQVVIHPADQALTPKEFLQRTGDLS